MHNPTPSPYYKHHMGEKITYIIEKLSVFFVYFFLTIKYLFIFGCTVLLARILVP